MATRVFTMEARLTPEMQARARDVLLLQNRYRNQLTEIERKRAAEFQETRRSFNPRLAEIDARLLELAERAERGGLDAYEQSERGALEHEAKPLRAAFNALLRPGDAEVRRRKEGLRTHRAKAAREQAVCDMCSEDWPPEWKAVAASNMRAHAALIAMRGASGLREEVYRPADDALQASRAKAAKLHVPFVPRFRQFSGAGQFAVQLRGGDAKELGVLELKTFAAEIAPLERKLPDTHRHPRFAPKADSSRPRKQFYAVGLRVSNEPGREWLSMTAMAHRPIPDGKLTWVKLVVRRRGAKLRYQLQLVIDSERWLREPPLTTEIVAVHVGWASLGDGRYAVGYAMSESGVVDELVLDLRMINTDQQPGERCDLHGIRLKDSLRAAQDRLFNVARNTMVDWLRGKPAEARLRYSHQWRDGEEVETTLAERCRTIGNWRDKRKLSRVAKDVARVCGIEARLVELWQLWRDERLRDADDLFDAPEAVMQWAHDQGVANQTQQLAVFLNFWARKQNHLEGYLRDEAGQGRNRRRYLMRCFARRLERKHAAAVVAAWDITEIPSATRKDTEESRAAKLARKNRTACAPGELREILAQAFGGARLENAREGDHAARCSRCGKISRPHAGEVLVTCSCGHIEDRRARWCRNVLRARQQEAA